MLGDNATLEPVVLLEPAPALTQPVAAVTRDRRGVGFAFGVQRLLGRAQPLATTLRGLQLRGKLIAACVAVKLVFSGVELGRRDCPTFCV
jgi:hypothetical protein